MKTPKTLFLILKKEYFDQIIKGEKTSEFREYKPFWINKLINIDGSFKHYDLILFQNGYQKNPPQITVECKSIKIIKEKKGFFKHQKYFEIELGKILNKKNISND